MRDRYFAMYQSVEFKLCYYETYKDYSYRMYCTYSVAMIVISLVSVTAWSISKSQPIIWAIIIGGAQLAQALATFLPWSKQLTALKYFVPAVKLLVLDVDKSWNDLNLREYKDEKIGLLLSDYERKYADIESQFLGDTPFSERTRLIESATQKAKRYFYNRFPEIYELEKECALHVKQQSASTEPAPKTAK